MQKNPNLPTPYIHSDVYSTMTGFTRFLHENEKYGWKYNKTENMNDSEYLVYTHLITDRANYTGFVPYKTPIKGFIKLNIGGFIKNPEKTCPLVLENKIYILEREDINKIRNKGIK